jgi:hypothetical protein
LSVTVVRSEKLLAETREEGDVDNWSRYQAMASEDCEDFMCGVVAVQVRLL